MNFNNTAKRLERYVNYYSHYVQRSSGMEMKDARQEILWRMSKAYKKFNPQIAQENTYFITVIKKESWRLIKKKKREDFLSNEVADHERVGIMRVLNCQNGDHKGDLHTILRNNRLIDRTLNLKVYFEDKVIQNFLLDETEKRLKSKAIEIFKRLRNGYRIKDIKKDLKISEGLICNYIRLNIKPTFNEVFN